MAICAQTCTITVAGQSAFEGHNFEITVDGAPIDVRKFTDGPFGSWKSCIKSGEIKVDTYEVIPNMTVGSTASVAWKIGATTYTAALCPLVNYDAKADVSGVVQFGWTFKIVGTVTGI